MVWSPVYTHYRSWSTGGRWETDTIPVCSIPPLQKFLHHDEPQWGKYLQAKGEKAGESLEWGVWRGAWGKTDEGQQDISPQGPLKITDVQPSNCFHFCESKKRFMYKSSTFMHDGFRDTGWVWMSTHWRLKMIPDQPALWQASSFTRQ